MKLIIEVSDDALPEALEMLNKLRSNTSAFGELVSIYAGPSQADVIFTWRIGDLHLEI